LLIGEADPIGKGLFSFIFTIVLVDVQKGLTMLIGGF
jgi:hypothetical protein